MDITLQLYIYTGCTVFLVYCIKKLYKRIGEIICFFPTNQNTLYLLRLFYSENEIITVCGRPAICTLISWGKSSIAIPCLFSVCIVSSISNMCWCLSFTDFLVTFMLWLFKLSKIITRIKYFFFTPCLARLSILFVWYLVTFTGNWLMKETFYLHELIFGDRNMLS